MRCAILCALLLIVFTGCNPSPIVRGFLGLPPRQPTAESPRTCAEDASERIGASAGHAVGRMGRKIVNSAVPGVGGILGLLGTLFTLGMAGVGLEKATKRKEA